MCVKKRNETATISTLFDTWFIVWPIVNGMQSYRKILATSGFDVKMENLRDVYIFSYLLNGSIKSLDFL